MERDIVEEVRKFVEEECKKPTSNYGYDPYLFHFVPVRNYAVELAKRSNADEEIVEIAAWLHDIGSIMIGRKDHHLTGVEIAEKKLKELNYPRERIERVKNCILTHRGSQGLKPETIEAQILVEADTLSAFDDITGLFQAAFSYEKLPRIDAKNSVVKKLENKWNQLSDESKELIKPKYEAIKLLLT